MSGAEARSLVTDLLSLEQEGKTLLTVNGAGFDFRVLAAASGLKKACAEMALNHVDLCFMMLAQRGFPLGLDAMAKGAGVEGKLHKVRLNDGRMIENMSGEMAPELWRAGERTAVLAYLKDDVRSTLETGEAVSQKRGIGWTAKSGKWNFQQFAKLLTVTECLAIPEPDTSWMTDPLTREKFLSWTGYLESEKSNSLPS
jgi:hypothetical protein